VAAPATAIGASPGGSLGVGVQPDALQPQLLETEPKQDLDGVMAMALSAVLRGDGEAEARRAVDVVDLEQIDAADGQLILQADDHEGVGVSALLGHSLLEAPATSSQAPGSLTR